MTTKITPSVLENTAVTPSTYGTASQVPTVTVDAQGRVTGASNTSIAIGTSQITSGTLADARLPDQASLTAANYYGDATKTVAIVTDAKGRIKSAANVTIAIASSAVSGLATSATTDTTNATNISAGTLAVARLADSGVSATTYGSAGNVSRVTVDTKGRITGASNVAIQIATSQITGYPSFAASATTDTTNAANITTGTLVTARLADSGVTATTYGTASNVSKFTVDAKGRITGASNTAIAIGAGAVSGLATVATSGRYDSLLANSGQPTIPTIPTSLPASDVYAWAKASTKPSYAYSEITSLPTIPTNTNQLTNGAGFITSAVTSIGEVGAIMGLFNKSLVPQGTITFYRIGQEVAGSNLFYVSGDGYNTTGNPGTRYSFNNKIGIGLEVLFSAIWDSPFASPLAPWAQGLPGGRSVVTVSGTWRAVRPNLYSVYTYAQSDNGSQYESFCPIGLWQRIA